MIDCLIIGDSIAVGTHRFRPECVAYAKGGINSWQWNKQNRDKALNARTVIISLGSNDHAGVKTLQELHELRLRINAEHVYWILPAIKPDVQSEIRFIADVYGDIVLPILSLQADKIHPSSIGYKAIAEETE